MKYISTFIGLLLIAGVLNAQETLQTVTDRGNTTTNSLRIGGYSVNANTTKLFIDNPAGKNWALSSGANMIRETGFHIYNWTDNPSSPLFTISDSGDVGIGIYTPQAGLDIFKSYNAGTTKALKLFYNGSWGTEQYAANYRFLDIASTEQGQILQLNGFGMGLGFAPPPYNSPDKLYVNGNVGIGTSTPKEKLSVNGKIRAHEIKVETANWPDYVFKKEYQLTPLSEVEKYINANGHLPEIPSALEVQEDGIALGELNNTLVKKIEELTLHLIEQQKQLTEQGKLIKELQEKSTAKK
jgi:hypothetical protein